MLGKRVGVAILATVFVGYWLLKQVPLVPVEHVLKNGQAQEQLEPTKHFDEITEPAEDTSRPLVSGASNPTDPLDDAYVPKNEPLTSNTEPREIWSPFITKESKKYSELMRRASDSDAPIVMGEEIYFRLVVEGDVVFSKVTEDEAVQVLYDPLNVYNSLVEKLNELEGHGDWSFEAEEIVRNVFDRHFNDPSYRINAIQCREKTCVIELTYDIIGAAETFTDLLRYNPRLCECSVGEYIWAEEMRAVFKIILI